MNGCHVGGSQTWGPKNAESRNGVVNAHLMWGSWGEKTNLPRTYQFYGRIYERRYQPNSDPGTPEGEYVANDAFTLMNSMTNTVTTQTGLKATGSALMEGD